MGQRAASPDAARQLGGYPQATTPGPLRARASPLGRGDQTAASTSLRIIRDLVSTMPTFALLRVTITSA